jgi:valyl-tRNA synthetase
MSGDPTLVDPVIEVLTRVRRAKTEAKQSQRASVERLDVVAPAEALAGLSAGEADLVDAGSITVVSIAEGSPMSCDVVLAQPV